MGAFFSKVRANELEDWLVELVAHRSLTGIVVCPVDPANQRSNALIERHANSSIQSA